MTQTILSLVLTALTYTPSPVRRILQDRQPVLLTLQMRGTKAQREVGALRRKMVTTQWGKEL